MAEDKPVVESFQLDHTKVKAPYVRYIDTETGPHGDVISNYDLRLVQPNENAIPTGGLHTIEHTIAVLLRENGWGIVNVDATVIAQQPKLAPHIAQMRENMAAAAGVCTGCVSVKATTSAGLGFEGRGEGITARCVALIQARADYLSESPAI